MNITIYERTGERGEIHPSSVCPIAAIRDVVDAVRSWGIGDIATLTLLATDLPDTTWFDARIITTDRVVHSAHFSEMGWVLA